MKYKLKYYKLLFFRYGRKIGLNKIWRPIYAILNKYILLKLKKNIPDKIMKQYKYFLHFNKIIDLNNPKTFSEKIMCRSLFDQKKIYTTCSDKLLVRNYIKNKIGEKYLIPLLLETKKLKVVDFEKLPEEFVIKSNHASGQILFVDKNKKLNIDKIIKESLSRLKINYYYNQREIQYRDINPKILIEKIIRDENNNIPNDYKFHCFSGKVEFIQIDSGRFKSNRKRINLNRDGSLAPFLFIPFILGKPAFEKDKNILPPKNLNKMIELAEKLSSEFNYVRVDLYESGDDIYFGELTFTPGAGTERFVPEKYDIIYGNKFIY